MKSAPSIALETRASRLAVLLLFVVPPAVFLPWMTYLYWLSSGRGKPWSPMVVVFALIVVGVMITLQARSFRRRLGLRVTLHPDGTAQWQSPHDGRAHAGRIDHVGRLFPFPVVGLRLKSDSGVEQLVELWRDAMPAAQWRELAVLVDGLRHRTKDSDSA